MSDKKVVVVTDVIIEEHPSLDLDAFCLACEVTPEFVQDLIDHGIIDVEDLRAQFNEKHMTRVRTVVHLQQDLEVNLPGAALALDLMDQLEVMRERLAMLEKLMQG